jgi:hypothetical protein
LWASVHQQITKACDAHQQRGQQSQCNDKATGSTAEESRFDYPQEQKDFSGFQTSQLKTNQPTNNLTSKQTNEPTN